MKRYFLIFCLCCFAFSLFAQENKEENSKYTRRIPCEKFIEELVQCKKSVYRLENAEIYGWSYQFVQHYLKEKQYLVSAAIELDNCNLGEMELGYIVFEKSLNITNSVGSFSADNCVFNKRLFFESSILTSFYLEQCQVDCGMMLNGTTVKSVAIKNSNFNSKGFDEDIELLKYQPISLIELGFGNKVDLLEIEKTVFKSTIEGIVLKLNIEFDNVYLTENQIRVPVDLKNITVEKDFSIENCIFSKPISLENTKLPEENSTFIFEQFAHKLCLFRNDTYQNPYLPENENLVDNVIRFNKMISVYSKLMNIFKIQGDTRSGNLCYIEKKELETRRLRYLYNKESNLNNFFQYKINDFLSFFCDYGTNPAKSTVISVYVILFFALIYFIFPSQKDNLQLERLVKKMQYLSKYVVKNAENERIKDRKNKKILQDLQQLHYFLHQSNEKLPSIFRVIGKPFYYLSLFYYKLNRWFIENYYLQQRNWQATDKKTRFLNGFIISFYFFIFVSSGFLMRSLNAITLSLNSFVTLGYGEISARGVSRYLAVLEGLIGWFLLGIFSVSLISQMLQ